MPDTIYDFSLLLNTKFPKSEKLCNQLEIQEIFKKGKHVNAYPLKFIYTLNSELTDSEPIIPPKVVISVSKKNFKRAHDRNRIKRIVREAYRLNKKILADRKEISTFPISISIIYVAKEIMAFNLVEEKLKQALLRL